MRSGAILFDFDGVIVDSDGFNVASLTSAAASLGIAFDDADYRSDFTGRNLREGATRFLGRRGREQARDEFIRAKIQFDARYLDYVSPYADALDLLDRLTGMTKLALVTGSRRVLVQQFLSAYGLERVFAVVVTAEDVVYGKPSPDPYIRGCAAIGIGPEHSLAVEDSPAGIRSARAAQLRCVAVTHTHSAAELAEANLVVDRLTLSGFAKIKFDK